MPTFESQAIVAGVADIITPSCKGSPWCDSRKRRRSGSLLSGPEAESELCIDRHVSAWDYPLSRGEKICRVLQLLEAEIDASWTAASIAEDQHLQAIADKDQLEAEQLSLRSRIAELEHQAGTERSMVFGETARGTRTSALSPEFTDVDSEDESDLYFSEHSMSETEFEGGLRAPENEFRLSLFHSDQEDHAELPDAPCDNLLAQLLLSEPLVPMLPNDRAWEELSQNVSSIVTPRCQVPSGQSIMFAPQSYRSPVGIGCLNLKNLDTQKPKDAQNKVPDGGLQGQLSTLITARRPLLHGITTSSGSISAVRWGGIDDVKWLHFVTHEELSRDSDASSSSSHNADVQSYSNAAVNAALPWDGELSLEQGETVQVLRGGTDGNKECLADWIVLVTSKLRSKKLGNLHGTIPTLSFIAAPGCEISDVVVGPDGRLENVRQTRIC